MNTLQLLLRLPIYKLFKRLELPGVYPFSYVFLITTKCNSRCSTCNLWKKPIKDELKTEEWVRVISSIGNSAAWVTITGGEPFIVPGIAKIVKSTLRYIKPKVLCMPTNASMPALIERRLLEILAEPGSYEIIINISLDDIGERHDKLRGTKDNFKKLEETVKRLKGLQKQHQNLKIGINTVISQQNISRLRTIYRYVTENIKPDDYIFETAQQRAELGTSELEFGLNKEKLSSFLRFLARENLKQLIKKRGMSFPKTLLRMRYYSGLLKQKPKKCNAGLLSCQILPTGDVINCGTEGMLLGNLRKHGYDVKKLWRYAAKKREKLRNRKCCCQLANIFYINRF